MKVKIPETLNDLTLSQFERFTKLEDGDDDFKRRMSLKIFYDLHDYEKVKASDVDYLIDSINKVFEEKKKLTNRFTLHGVAYGLIPDFDYMTFGEFVDLDKFSADNDYKKIASILYRPIVKENGKRYRIESYKGANDDLQDMPLGVFLGVLDFFLTIGEQLLNDTLKSLKEEQMLKKLGSQKNGGGTLRLMHLQEAITSSIRILRNQISIAV